MQTYKWLLCVRTLWERRFQQSHAGPYTPPAIGCPCPCSVYVRAREREGEGDMHGGCCICSSLKGVNERKCAPPGFSEEGACREERAGVGGGGRGTSRELCTFALWSSLDPPLIYNGNLKWVYEVMKKTPPSSHQLHFDCSPISLAPLVEDVMRPLSLPNPGSFRSKQPHSGTSASTMAAS